MDSSQRPPVSGSSARSPLAPTEEQLGSGSGERFSAFAHRNFRLFWIGNLISLVGTLAQQTAQGWLVRTLTPNAFYITAVAAAGTAPLLLFTLFAGALADRVDKRRALIIFNLVAALLALVLAALVWTKYVQVWHVAAVAFFAGTVNAFDIPVRQSFNVEMVGRKDLPNAIALNSSAFNAARVAGPMAGGFLLQLVGIGGCFAVNAISYLALIFNLTRLDIPRAESPSAPMRLADIREGWEFVWGNPTLRLTVVLVTWTTFWAMSYSPLLPVFAKDIYGTDERGFAILAACNGMGALASALSLAAAGAMRHRGKRLLLGALGFSLSIVAFGACKTLLWGGVTLVLAGWFLLTFLMTANTLVQTIAPDEMRGRVFSVYSMGLIGTAPLGALGIGALARVLGSPGAVLLGGEVSAVFTLWLWWKFRVLWKEK